MAKEVILTAPVEGLGIEGDVVKVSDGYARNFLMPRKLAAPVSDSIRRQLAGLREKRLAELATELEKAETLAGKLAEISCTLPVKTHDGGKLFGSVSASDIAKAITAAGVKISRNQVKLKESIHELGVFDVKIEVHPQVSQAVKVWIVEE